MRILAICMRYPPEGVAGVANTVATLSETAVNAGHQVLIASRTPQSQLLYEPRNGVDVLRVPLAMTMQEAGTHLLRAGRSAPPDVIDVHLNNGFPLGAILRLSRSFNVPLVQFLHFYSLICRPGTLYRGGVVCASLCDGCKGYNEATKQFTRQVDGVVSVSRHVLDRHLEAGHFAGTAHRIAPPMVDFSIPERPQRTRGSPIFGFIGRLRPEKGIEQLLDIARQRQLTLRVAGAGPEQYVSRLRGRYAGDKITFLGWQGREAFFPEIDIAVVPSRFPEPFGRVSVEAQGCGVPVVIARVGGLAETFEEGTTGWGFDPAVAGSFEQAIERAAHEYVGTATACRALAKRFLPVNIWPGIEEFLTDMVARPRVS